MNDTEFKELTRDRDRRGEDPTELNLEINDNGEQLAFEMHCIWCQEANHFTPIEYAKHKLGQGIHGKPEQLQEITGILPLSLLSEDKLGIVADLAEKDGEVWFYLKEWFLNGLAGDPRPDLIPPALTSLVRLMINGEKPNTRSQPTVIRHSDEAISAVARQLHSRYGYAPYSEACLEVLSEATGLSVATVEDKLRDAGKGTNKKSFRRKKRRRKT